MITTAPHPRRMALLVGAAALVLATGTAVAVTQSGSSATPAASSMGLRLSDGSVAASCAIFSPEFLRDMSPAFAGTVSSVDDSQVVLQVDRWYAGGPADTVVLTRPASTSSASLDGVDFRSGERYLVTAASGQVNGCGYSGPATAELTAAYEQAFAR